MLDLELTQMTVELFSEQTERDKQRTIGASNASNPCNKCLAEDMLGTEQERGWAWLPAVVGTAIHELAEFRLKVPGRLRTMFGEPLTEKKMVIGSVPGYGDVKSTSDLYVPDRNLVLDWKTTTKAKLKQYVEVDAANMVIDPDLYTQAKYDTLMEHMFTMRKYLNQCHLYGMGMIRMGYEVESVAMGFICRDGMNGDDIKVFRYAYDPELAEKVWNRIGILWGYLQDGKTPDDFDGNPYCWYCQNKR